MITVACDGIATTQRHTEYTGCGCKALMICFQREKDGKLKNPVWKAFIRQYLRNNLELFSHGKVWRIPL